MSSFWIGDRRGLCSIRPSHSPYQDSLATDRNRGHCGSHNLSLCRVEENHPIFDMMVAREGAQVRQIDQVRTVLKRLATEVVADIELVKHMSQVPLPLNPIPRTLDHVW